MDERAKKDILSTKVVGHMYYYASTTVIVISCIDGDENRLLVQDEDGEYYEVSARELY